MRIWVTGIGVVSPLARGAAATMDRLVSGDRALGELSLFALPGARSKIAGEVKGLLAKGIVPEGDEIRWSRTDAMALLAAKEALLQAKLDPRSDAVSLAAGGSTTGMFENELELGEMSRDPKSAKPLASVVCHPLSSTADRLHETLGGFERTRSVCSACSSGANAMLLATTWLRAGIADRVLAGGADAMCRLTFAGFSALAAMSPEPCRPFDKRRLGLNLGEAAAFLVLETEASARARGVTPIAELAGWACFAEANHITNPERSGATAAKVIATALRRGNVGAAELDYINAHGTATPLNDAMEAAAIRSALGAEADRVFVSSSKGQIGHTLAAAGAIEAAITAMTIARGEIPPTVGLEEIDPECRLVHVLASQKLRVRAAASNSFGFGGTDTTLLFSEPELFAPHEPKVTQVVITGGASIGPLGVIGSAATAAYTEPGPPAPEPPITVSFGEHLDLSRARRIDRGGRLVTLLVKSALDEAKLTLEGEGAFEVGAIIGAAFAGVDASTAFIRRFVDKGVGMAPPADFPNLVPSSPSGHASIYLGLRGLVFNVADLGETPESAIASAVDLCKIGEAGAIVAGSLEEATPIVDLCIGPVTSGPRGHRYEGGAAIVVETEAHARARGARIQARIAWSLSWRGSKANPLASAPKPEGASLILSAHEGARVLEAIAGSAWQEVPRMSFAARTGDHEGAGGFALPTAASWIAEGRYASILVVGEGPDRSIAFVLTASDA
jgi:3-oxoacyl-[acyl-carrier-protein] synthase II